jgi:hypothetical protein
LLERSSAFEKRSCTIGDADRLGGELETALRLVDFVIDLATGEGAHPAEDSSFRRRRGADISALPSVSVCCSPPFMDLPAFIVQPSGQHLDAKSKILLDR